MTVSRRTRPSSISVLAIFVLWFASWNGLRLSEAIYFWKTLEEYGAYPLYIFLSGGVWLIIGLFLVWNLWQGKAMGWIAAICISATYATWYWFDRLVLQKPHANWPFALIADIVILLLFLYILFLRKTRRYFHRDAYERQSKSATPS